MVAGQHGPQASHEARTVGLEGLYLQQQAAQTAPQAAHLQQQAGVGVLMVYAAVAAYASPVNRPAMR